MIVVKFLYRAQYMLTWFSELQNLAQLKLKSFENIFEIQMLVKL